MDYQNRVGSRHGGGGVAGISEVNVDRRDRLRKLAMETIDLAKVSWPFCPIFSYRPWESKVVLWACAS